ncbi:TonB-dependent receptor domain-containing protein [Chitinophaga qingshengii]|uniref:TonB-dependent receptor n=1 Tax=Chitinophaga qingshengii TaxID=1569794 RepID=A0ABR7TI40_9BACT|nr:TonB-dependent receptor [Chitinophaga qingshengii]MBC9930170.1 TonB-dependent receptor [Chitinophaga qingshengii]
MQKNTSSSGLLTMMLRTGKYLLLFMTAIALMMPLPAISQQLEGQKISLQLSNRTIKEALGEIQQQSPFKFVYGDDINKYSSVKVSLRAGNITVKSALEQVLKNTNLRFTQRNDHIMIDEKPAGSTPARQQEQAVRPGRITGKIVSDKGEPLIGASIRIAGDNRVTQSTTDGSYAFTLAPGTYTVEISYISFQSQRVTDVVVKDNGNTPLTVAMKAKTNTLDQVVVTSGYKKASVSGLLLKQKNAAALSDGIAAEQIARSPDNNAADALARVTGLTTIEKKYVVVRGMGERWNETAIDGVTQPSTEPLRKAFSFDLIPASLIDNIVVSKTPTPDMNANFTGGYVQVNTKDIPDQNFLTVSLGTSYNDLSTFREQLGRKAGKHDFLGFDDGRRNLPGREQVKTLDGLKTDVYKDPLKNPALYEQSRLFVNDNFTTYSSNTPLGLHLKLAGGKVISLGKEKRNRLGAVAAVSFRNSQEREQIDFISRGGWQNALGLNLADDHPNASYLNTGNTYNFNTTWGALLNVGFQTPKSKLAFRNIYSHIFNQDFTRVVGWNRDQVNYKTDIPAIEEVNRPLFTDFVQHKLEGRHHLRIADLDWSLAHTSISRNQKDVTYLSYSNAMVNGEVVNFPVTNTINSANRFPFSRGTYSYKGKDLNWSVAAAFPFNIRSEKQIFKLGYFGADRNGAQDYFEAGLYNLSNNLPREFLYNSAARLQNPENFREKGLAWVPTYAGNSKYEGKVFQHAPFAMFDNRAGKFRLVWGVRAEYYKYEELQNPNDGRYGNEDKPLPEDKKWRYLPSANFTYSPWRDFNFRLAYAKTVSRPQFAERNRFSYYDPAYSAYIWNTPVKSSITDGYDFKAEWYPEPGDVLSGGVYYRDMADPIEMYNFFSATNKSEFTLRNSKRAQVYGLEIDVQKNFGFIHETLRNLRFTGNFSLNNSKVDTYGYTSIDEEGNPLEKDANGSPITKEVVYRDNRPLYGQSPYSYNVGLSYTGGRLGANVLYNKTGRKYTLVGSMLRYAEMQAPYGKADLQLSYKCLRNKNLEVVLNISNLFNESILYYNNDASYEYDAEVKNVNNQMDPRLGNPSFYTKHIVLKPGKSDNYDKGDQVTYKAHTGRRFTLNLNYKF